MGALATTIDNPLPSDQRIGKANELLEGGMFADFQTGSVDVRISIGYPGELDRVLHVTDRNSGNVAIFRMDRDGDFLASESHRQISEEVLGVTIHRFERGEPPPQLEGDRVLALLQSRDRVNRAA